MDAIYIILKPYSIKRILTPTITNYDSKNTIQIYIGEKHKWFRSYCSTSVKLNASVTISKIYYKTLPYVTHNY